MLRIAFTCLLHVANVYRSVFLFTFTLNLFRDNTPSPYQVRTKTAPSSLHACISLAPSLHDNRAVYAVNMRVSRIINLRNPELLSLPWSEQRAKEKRTRSGEMPPKPVPAIPNPDVDNYPKIQVRAIKQKVYAIKIHIPLQSRKCFRFILLPFSIYYSSCKFRIYLLFYLNTCFIGRPIHT
jgi:hypothetical protein